VRGGQERLASRKEHVRHRVPVFQAFHFRSGIPGADGRVGLADEDTFVGGRDVDPWEVTVTGTIRTLRVDKGFGFIKDAGGKEYFFHRSAVYGEGLENLREGDGVEFDVGQGPKGPRAENVRRTTT
jgi:cold shock protein